MIIKFRHDEKDEENATPSIFTTQFMMQPTFTSQNVQFSMFQPRYEYELCLMNNIIYNFRADGYPVQYFKDPETGHCPWGINCECDGCYEDSLTVNYEPIRPKKSKRKAKASVLLKSHFYRRYLDEDPLIAPLG
ncbi:hypothetical protein PVK06_000611 [Gossypium arboreum]|uniref:Uncharacterized protein n=1 Tax=Gossypium arboreum TaxID=29729 RepID=A0ABR0QYX0_GOSAR|nr:hypothetical protein PVK06_000611 [Gossypium arboreum]